jgi:hypothetical protein
MGAGFEPWKARATSGASEHVFLRFESGPAHIDANG